MAEGWAVHRGVWCAEVGVVKSVKSFQIGVLRSLARLE